MAHPQYSQWLRCPSDASLSTGSNRTVFNPRIVAEVEDTALLTDLGTQGLGFVPVYSAVLDEIARSSRLQTIGIAKGLRMEIFAIAAQRRLRHLGVVAMTAKPE
jgi:hypothetical protein